VPTTPRTIPQFVATADDEAAPALACMSHQRILVTVTEAADVLGIGRTLMYALVTSGAVESVTIGGLRRIPTDALTAYVASLRAGGAADGSVAA
jgi:excisionase family DNA binding protein